MVARSAIRRGREVRVTETAAAAMRSQPAIAVVTQVVQQVTCRSIKDLCPHRNANNRIFAVMARTIRALTMQTTLRYVAWVVAQVQQGVERSICDENYIATATTVSA